MHLAQRAFATAIMFVTCLLISKVDSYGQEATASTDATPVAHSVNKLSSEEPTATPAVATKAVATAASTPEPDFWTQEHLTGDWGGTRSRWQRKGFELEFKLSQFYQGVASGGVREGSVYNGKLKTAFKFDLGKLAGWNFWQAEIGTETRFGAPLLGGTGAINPVNTTAIIPAAAGTVFSITAVNFTRLIPIDLKKGDLFAVSFGRYNLVDLLEEDFFAGGGTERFMNIAQIGPLTVLREVPLITNAASFAYIRGGEPIFTFAVMDPNDYSLEPGLAELFQDGVTFAPGINFPAKYWGKTAKHTLSGAVTTKKYTPFDAIRQIIIPGPPLNPVEPKRGSWSASYVFRQYIVERGRKDGWGFFTQVAFANKDTSPISTFFNAGLGGNGLIKSRPTDEFGIAYAFTNLSSVLKDNINLLPLGGRRLLAEHQTELFYNFHLTPWLRLTGDLQIIRPVRSIANTAVVPGARLELIF